MIILRDTITVLGRFSFDTQSVDNNSPHELYPMTTQPLAHLRPQLHNKRDRCILLLTHTLQKKKKPKTKNIRPPFVPPNRNPKQPLCHFVQLWKKKD